MESDQPEEKEFVGNKYRVIDTFASPMKNWMVRDGQRGRKVSPISKTIIEGWLANQGIDVEKVKITQGLGGASCYLKWPARWLFALPKERFQNWPYQIGGTVEVKVFEKIVPAKKDYKTKAVETEKEL